MGHGKPPVTLRFTPPTTWMQSPYSSVRRANGLVQTPQGPIIRPLLNEIPSVWSRCPSPDHAQMGV
jgi:hypothetical protein